MKKSLKKFVLGFLLAIFAISSLFLFVGCQSTDKTKAYITTSTDTLYTTIEYNQETDETTIRWTTTITNNTIYEIEAIRIYLNLYNEGTIVHKEIDYTFPLKIAAGKKRTESLKFKANGKITKIEFADWSGKYSTFWKTYQLWIYITLGVVGVVAFIYIIIMIVNDLELWETWDNIQTFFEDHAWLFWIFVIVGGAIIASIVTSYWVQLLIVLGGILSTVVLGLIAHLIKHFIDNRRLTIDPMSAEESIEEYNIFGKKKKVIHRKYAQSSLNTSNTDDDDDDEEQQLLKILQSKSMKELRDICRKNGITGFTTLTKEETIELLLENYRDNTDFSY